MGQRVSQIDQENLQKVAKHLITTKLCRLMGQPDPTEDPHDGMTWKHYILSS